MLLISLLLISKLTVSMLSFQTPILDVFGLSDNFCQSAEFGHGGDQNGTISCSKWTPTSASASIYSQTKWAQTVRASLLLLLFFP